MSAQVGYHNLAESNTTPQAATGGPNYVPPQNFPPFTLPPSDFSTTSAPAPREAQPTYAPPVSSDYSDPNHHQQSGSSDLMLLDQMSVPATIPIFGPADSMLNKSPYVGMPEDFMAYLFNTNGGQPGDGSPMLGAQMPQYK
jgi:hypothetical protein